MLLKLRPTVVTSFVAITLVVVAAVSYSNYRQGITAAEKTASDLIAKTEHLTTENISKLLVTSKLLVEAISEFPTDLASDSTPETMADLLRVYADKVPLMYSVYIGFSDGQFVQAVNLRRPDGTVRKVAEFPANSTAATRYTDPVSSKADRAQVWRFFDGGGNPLSADQASPRTSYDPRTRPWYERAITDKNLGSSSIYIFASLREPGVTISMPMRNVPGDNGVIAVISDDGSVVAHPNAEKIVRRSKQNQQLKTVKISEIDDALLHKANEVLKTDQQGRDTFLYQDQRYIASVAAIDELPGDAWRVVSVAAIDDFTGAAQDALTNSLLIAVAILLLALAVITVLANWVAKPINEASSFAEALSQLTFDKEPPTTSPLLEVQNLTEAMVRMRAALITFLKYAPKDLVQELILSGKSARIGGHRQEITLMFTDIEGFTTISEKLTPEDVMSYMSIYFELLSKAISDHKGVIDKFIGDAIMAMWNAPIANPDHVPNACDAALLACRESNSLNAELAANNFPQLRTRFGLHCCDALVGNIGAPDRMQFTSLGAGVNLASRIEGLNKFYRTQILVSDTIRRKAGAGFFLRRIDLVTAKGTTRPVTVFELLGKRDEDSEFFVGADTIQLAVKYEQAFDFYLHRDFDDAVSLLEELANEAPDDFVIESLLAKCRKYAAEPPGPEWDGSTVLDEK